MSKWIIASDIHGSAGACEALIEAAKREKADRMLLLGDILYHGPRNKIPEDYNPKKVADLLNDMKECILCVRGNCDADVDQLMLQFPIMADYAYICLGKWNVFATHGHLYNKEKMPPLHFGDILLHGHTHVSVCEVLNKANENLYMNPGSVSMPKEDTKAGYMIMTEDAFTWKTLDGEIIKTYK